MEGKFMPGTKYGQMSVDEEDVGHGSTFLKVILLNGFAVKCFLNIDVWTHRLVPLSTLGKFL